MFSNLFGFNINFIAPYNHHSNGKTERRNLARRDMLRNIGYDLDKSSYIDLNWSLFLPAISFVINISLEPDTQVTPWEMRNHSMPPILLNYSGQLI